MSSVKDLSRLILVVLVAFLSLSETAESPANQTSSNSPLNQTVTRTSTLSPRPSTTNQTLEHNAFAKMDRGTVIRGAVVLSGITALILMYAGIKAALLRKKNQPKKYTLIDNLTAMEEPLFGAQNNEGAEEEEEAEDDTLFARK